MNDNQWLSIQVDSWGIATLLERWGIESVTAIIAERLVIILLILLTAVAADFIARRIIVRGLHKLFLRSRVKWDNLLVEKGVLLRLSRIAPALVFYVSASVLAPELPWIGIAVRRLSAVWIIVTALLATGSILDVVHDVYRNSEVVRKRPIKGLIQLSKVVLFTVGGILLITTLFNQSPLGILSGLGAMSAILLLIFRDTILGFVSGIQLSSNNMVEIGDWIEMSQYGADGVVTDITLQTIKVQNWDKTITSIPIYALISDSFRNWRGMTESGGRRIKRSISIDMRSIRFVNQEMLSRYRRFAKLRAYLDSRQSDIEAYNREHNIDLEDTVSGRRMTNIGVFRAYVLEYLKRHSDIRTDMTLMVRQLPPGPTGVPIEVFIFASEQRWVEYEQIQSDIFDHLLAVVPEFDLLVFQEPSGSDIAAIGQALQH